MTDASILATPRELPVDAATGGAGRARLTTSVVPVPRLDQPTRDAAFALFAAAYAGTDRARFERDLADKQLVVLLRDARTSDLKGFSTVNVSDVPGGGRNGRRATVVFSGDTVIDPAYWGQKQLQKAFTRLLLRLKLRAPHRELYWFLICKGYKTYLLITNHCAQSIPRCDRAADPKLEALLQRVASGRFGERYDPATGIITNIDDEHERVRDGLAPITDELRAANPHIRYFDDTNPGHERGDELACIAEIDLTLISGQVARATVAAMRGRRRPARRS